MRQLQKADAASAMLAETRSRDPLDLWLRHLDHVKLSARGHALLSLGLLLESSGQLHDTIDILHAAADAAADGSQPLALIPLSRCCEVIGDDKSGIYLEQAARASATYCFPSGLDRLASWIT